MKPFVSFSKTNKREQLPALADETSVSRCMVLTPLLLWVS